MEEAVNYISDRPTGEKKRRLLKVILKHMKNENTNELARLFYVDMF